MIKHENTIYLCRTCETDVETTSEAWIIWYNCAFCDSGSISDWNNFFVFNSFQIVSTYRFRNACARLIFIKLFINRASLHSFFFSSLFLYKLMCAGAEMTFLVYYENDFSCVLREWLLSCIIKHSFVDYTLTAKALLKLDIRFLHAIRLLYNNISIFYFLYLWFLDFEGPCHFLQ